MKQCYLCRSVGPFKKRNGNVRDNPALDIYECPSCGLVFLSSFDHIKGGFYEGSGMHGQEELSIDNWLKASEKDDVRRFELFKSQLLNRRVLDFGCGAGGFLLRAKSLAMEACGVDLEQRVQKHLAMHDIEVFPNLGDITKRKFDLITLFHVIEHLPDPRFLLCALKDVIADRGELIIECPSANDVLLSFYGCDGFANFTYWSCHLFLFTIDTLKMLFEQCAMNVNYIRQVQRYPLSNHLYWLAKGKPGGHIEWGCVDSPQLNDAYEKKLALMGYCDTILASVSL